MVILQGIFALVSKSLSGVLNAIFGWAVVALFGHTGEREKTMLSAVVASAAAWPFLIVGVIFPKAAAMAIAFVPMSKNIPTIAFRIVWIALAALVPFVLGFVFAARAPRQKPPESFLKKALRGVPLTLGLAGAFLMMLFIAPCLQVVSILRKRRDQHIPLLTEAKVYAAISQQLAEAFNAHRIVLRAVTPPWWMTAPSTILRKMGGPVTSAFVPEKLAYFSGPELDFALYPSEALMRGAPTLLARAHGILSETLGPLPALESSSTAAQDLERQLKDIWRVHDELPSAHDGSAVLQERVKEVLGTVSKTALSEEDWIILYRISLQVVRALSGKPQLLQGLEGTGALHMPVLTDLEASSKGSLEKMSLPELGSHVLSHATLLAKKEIELASEELRRDVSAEIEMAKGLGIAAILGLTGLNMLCVAGIFGLALLMPGWVAGLAVGGGILAIAAVFGLMGWGKKVNKPLERTRKTVEETVEWAKNRVA